MKCALVLAFGALMALSGCKKIQEKLAEKAIENSTGGDASLSSSSGGMAVDDGKGNKATYGEAAKLPDNWPDDVPAYPGGKLATAMSAPQMTTGSFTTSDSAEKVIAFYKGKLTAWKKVSELDQGPTSKILTVAKDKKQCTVMARSGGGIEGTMATVTISWK